MADDTDITLWVNRHRLKALHEHDINVENRLDCFFNSLYKEFVPPGEREIIEARIQSEQEESDRATEQSRRFALLTIVQDGEWAEYGGDQLTKAVRAATRKQLLKPHQREEIFETKLNEVKEPGGMTMT